MKRIILFVVALLLVSTAVMAQKAEGGIKWLSIDDLQVKMKEKPKKVYIDMYTDWCGWCKKMEASTFSNPDVIKYMNENFYCVRFNAERKDVIYFMGKQYGFDPEKRMNTLAAQWIGPKVSYPTSIIMEAYYQNPQPISGYLKVSEIELVLKYFAENAYKTTPWPDYQKSFKSSWVAADESAGAPAGH